MIRQPPGSTRTHTPLPYTTLFRPTVMRKPLIRAGATLLPSAGCDKNEAAEEKLERAAETSATVAGPGPAALGLSEAQLLDAEIVGADGQALGDVAQVLRDAGNKVDRLLVEIEDSNPDRSEERPVGQAGVSTG